ncbi:MAG: multiheme c-type cytochrome [Armatimonadota bacterium]
MFGRQVLSTCLVAALVAILLVSTVANQTPRKIRVIYTNDTLGYLESCGCGGVRSGGLARRAVLISQLKQENPHCVILESGNLANTPDKLGLITSVLATLGYDAVGVGETDVRTCGEEFYKKAAQAKLTVIDPSPNAPKTAVPYIVKNVDGVRVGVVSFGFWLNPSEVDDFEAMKAFYSAYSEARRKSDILIVLDQKNIATREWIETNEKRFGAPDIVIGGMMRRTLQHEDVVGRTRIVPTSIQGRELGVVDIETAPGQLPTYSVRKIPIDDKIAEDVAIKKRVEEFMGKIPQIPTYTPTGSRNEVGPQITKSQGPAYYPPLLCKGCHAAEYEQWAGTKHAKAVETLTSQNRAIPECLKCHSEMFRRLQRLTLTSGTPAGVDCMTCHAGSLPHGIERRESSVRVKVDTKICVECHDKEWSPNYNEKIYLPKITHGPKKDAPSTSAGSQTQTPTSPAELSNPPSDSRPPAPPPIPVPPPTR